MFNKKDALEILGRGDPIHARSTLRNFFHAEAEKAWLEGNTRQAARCYEAAGASPDEMLLKALRLLVAHHVLRDFDLQIKGAHAIRGVSYDCDMRRCGSSDCPRCSVIDKLCIKYTGELFGILGWNRQGSKQYQERMILILSGYSEQRNNFYYEAALAFLKLANRL